MSNFTFLNQGPGELEILETQKDYKNSIKNDFFSKNNIMTS